MKVYWGNRSTAPRPKLFTLRVRAPGTLWTGGWVGPRAGLDAVVKRKNHVAAPAGNLSPAVQPVVYSLY
jgi:hypothetical protein